MKKGILTLIVMAGVWSASAQISDGVSATLQNGETTSVYYGFDSFKEALTNAPDEGGVITLSPGAFNNPGDISKSVKVYGAGFQADEAVNLGETRINGTLTIRSTDDISPVVRLEGVYVFNDIILIGTQKIENTEIVKCSFNTFLNRVETNNTIIRQCYLRYDVGGENNKATAFVIANSLFRYIRGFLADSQVRIDHCIMFGGDGHNGAYFYTNNIMNHPYYAIDAGATCYNNVGYSGILSNGNNNNCVDNYYESVWSSWQNLFADGQNNLNYQDGDGKPRTWELADPSTYVGTDGTPCGLTGGDYPWNPIPVIPRIISTSVDSKTTPGVLKVAIKAEARPLE